MCLVLKRDNLLSALKEVWSDGMIIILDLDGTLLHSKEWPVTPLDYVRVCERYGKFYGKSIWMSRVVTDNFEIKDKGEIVEWLKDKPHLFVTNRSRMLLKATYNCLRRNGFNPGTKNLWMCQGQKIEFIAGLATKNSGPMYIAADDDPVEIAKIVDRAEHGFKSIIQIEVSPLSSESFVALKHYGKVIALSGKMGSGKDTVTEILVNKIYPNLKCTVVRFADSLKQFVSELMPDKHYSEKTKTDVVRFERQNVYNAYGAFERFNLRIKAFQNKGLKLLPENAFFDTFLLVEMSWSKWHAKVGQFCREYCGYDVFVILAEQAIIEAADTSDMVIVNDTRFENECEMLLRIGVPVIRLERSRDLRAPYFNGRDPENVSEVDLDVTPFDYSVTNDGSIDELEARLKKIVM